MVHTAPIIVLNLKSFDANKYNLVQQLVSSGTTSKTRQIPSNIHWLCCVQWQCQLFSAECATQLNVADSLICNKE